jgi:hypothetical protein
VVVTTGTATTAIIIGITTTIIIIGTGQAIPGITAIGKAPARASEPEGLNLRLFLRHNRGNACSPCLGALPGWFQTIALRYRRGFDPDFFSQRDRTSEKANVSRFFF